MAKNLAFDEARAWLVALHKRRVLVLACAGAGLLVAILSNHSTRPVYEATAQLLIDWRAPSVLPYKNLVENNGTAEDYYYTHSELLRARDLLAHVIERAGAPLRSDLATAPTRSLWSQVRGAPTAAAAAPPGAEAIPGLVETFRARLAVQPVQMTRLVNLRFRAFDPGVAAGTVNTLAESYIAQAVDQRFSDSTAATSWLSERLAEQQARVAEAEKAVQRYREREGLVNLAERRGTVEQKLAALNGAATSARAERIGKESLLTRVHGRSTAELLSFPLVKSSPVVEGLRARLAELKDQEVRLAETLGDRHPDLLAVRTRALRTQEQIDAEVADVVRSVEADYGAALETEQNLTSSVEDAKREALALGRRALECDALERAAVSHRKLLEDLMSRSKQVGLESELKLTNLRLIERAQVPRAPIAPRSARNLTLGLLMGLLAGVGLAWLFEHMDNTLKTPEDVKVHLGVPFLGMIPELRGTQGPLMAGPGAMVDAQSAAADAYRVLRTNLMFSSAEAVGRAYLVTSASPGEGKTTTVANLAMALAQNGARVLAVDADLRRPTLHQHFGVEKTPGLSDLIVGSIGLTDGVQHTKTRGLQILPAGYLPPNPAELLGSASMRELLALLRKRFDWVLFDAPPVLAMADALVVCTHVDGTIMVACAERSALPAVQRAIDHITGVTGKLTGVVLNRVDLARNSYYYNQHYGEYYQSYYARDEESPSSVRSVSGQ